MTVPKTPLSQHHEIASMGGFYLEVFCSGNMTSQEVEDYIKCFSKKLGLTKDVMKENQFRQERVYKVELTFNLASL